MIMRRIEFFTYNKHMAEVGIMIIRFKQSKINVNFNLFSAISSLTVLSVMVEEITVYHNN